MKITTGEAISIGTGRLCCPMEKLYELYQFLVGQPVWTHQLPRAFKACDPWVKKQLPWLSQVNESECTRENWQEWLAGVEARHGKEHEISPLPPGQWQSKDAVAEAVELMEDKNRVIIIVV